MANILPYISVICLTVLPLSMTEVEGQAGEIGLDSKMDENYLLAIVRRLNYLEARDLEHERNNNMIRHQLTSYRKELDVLNQKNNVLVDRVIEIEAVNEELRKRLNDVEPIIETIRRKSDVKNVDHATMQFHSSYAEILNDTVSHNKRAENEGTVAFYTTLTNNLLHLGVNQNIIFDQVVTNLGNGYNVHAGDFRAPFDGTYVFSITLTSYGTHSNHYRFTKNNITVGQVYNRGAESPFASVSLTTVLQLKLGDTIAVKNVEADEYLYGKSFTAFSGFLLQQDYSYPAIVG